jgi:hypothetical protein
MTEKHARGELSLFVDIIRDYKRLSKSMDRFNRAIDIVEWVQANNKTKKYLSARDIADMKESVMACSPSSCPTCIFDCTQESFLSRTTLSRCRMDSPRGEAKTRHHAKQGISM